MDITMMIATAVIGFVMICLIKAFFFSSDGKLVALKAAIAKYPKPEKLLKYGTAGFREKADILESTFLRMGMLAALRSQNTGKAVGLMVTASHNAEPDNGIKMVDPDGGMLAQEWEKHAALLANAEEGQVTAVLLEIAQAVGVQPAEVTSIGQRGVVFIAQDTRPHSEKLSRLAIQGASLVGGMPLFFGKTTTGILTTPQLHHIVRMHNGKAASGEYFGKKEWASEEGYYQMLAEGYAKLLATADKPVRGEERGPLVVDCAYGVGAPQMAKMAEHLEKHGQQVVLKNLVGEGPLNSGCGAEFVQKGRVPPANFGKEDATHRSPGGTEQRSCSFDGDADRIVFHYWDDKLGWQLLDGDKIAALCARFFKENLKELGLDCSLAVVQTAYANGASTRYISGLGVQVAMAKTGVKFVHHEALKYDIGIYFEANGHGTVILKDSVLEQLHQQAGHQAATRLLAAHQLINQAVGDAISDALFVEAVLAVEGWTAKDWNAWYSDLPSRQLKLAVKDRAVVKCTDDETQAIAPAPLQPALEAAMAKFEQGRCFVRPSGTEDVVRVYAEAKTEEMANQLALMAAQAAYDHAGGIGDRPK